MSSLLHGLVRATRAAPRAAQARRWAARLLKVALLTSSMPLAAQLATSSGYTSKCQSCHSDLKPGLGTQFPPLFPSQNSSAVYGTSSSIPGAIFGWSALDVTGTPGQIVAAMRDKSRIPTTSAMHGYFDNYIGASPPTAMQGHATDADLLSIYQYLRLVRDAEVEIPTSVFPAIAIGLTSNQFVPIKIHNYRSVPLKYEISVTPLTAAASEFSITAPATLTGTCAATLTDNATECVIDTTVTFRPATPPASRTARLDVKLTSLNASDGDPIDRPDRHFTLSGTGLTPFTVAPSSILTFTPTTAPAGTRTVTINDNKGDRIRICRVAATSFSAPTNFSLDAPGPFDANGCFTSATSTVPRQIPLVLHFVPDAPGPRFANLAIQRLDDSSNPTEPVTTLQLQGNPGAVATLDASSLFDASGDPGVEVDGDTTLTRQVTLSSEGNEPLPFTGSTFTIGGPNGSDYAIADTGCKTLAQLPASTSIPGPSCVLTVVFNPSDVGRRGPATLTIQIAGISDNIVKLNGLGFRGPRLAVRRGVTPLASGVTVPFGAQTIGGIYPSIPVTLTNGGTQGNLDVVLPATGSLPGFSFPDPVGCRQLAPGGECELGLQFSPTAAQVYATPLLIQTRPTGTSDPAKTFELDLRGQGSISAVPTLRWTDSSGTPIPQLAFTGTTAGTPVTTKVRLYNAGPGGARPRFANAIGVDSDNFTLDTASCKSGLDLFEGMSCEVAVTFAPRTAGQKSASMQFVAEAGTPPVTVVAPYLAVIGTSRAATVPALLQSSTSLVQFATTVIGSSAAPAELRLTNNGSAALSVLDFDIGVPFGVQARTCAAVPFVLAPGAECAVNLTFQPQAEGRATGRLRITTDTTLTVLEVALDGTGQPKADVSSGGCSMVSGDTLADPTLWTMALLAFAVLCYRYRARGERRRRS